MRSLNLLAVAVLAASSIGPLAAAQAPGALVRVTHDGPCCQSPLTGTLIAATADSLWIRPRGSAESAAPVALSRQSVRQFERGGVVGARRTFGAGAGLVAGMVVGGAIGVASACSQCDYDALATVGGAVTGGLVGMLAGIVIGGTIPHYVWQQEDAPRRFGVALGPQRSMQIAASLRY